MDRIFDFHMHFFARDVSGPGVIRRHLEGGRLAGTLCCTDLYISQDDPVEINRPILDMAREFGRHRLPLLATVHPTQDGWRERLERLLGASEEIVGLKLHPPVGRYQVALDLLAPVFEVAEARGLIIASHTCPLPGQSAMAFLPLLDRFKKTPFVIYHASTHEESAYLSMRPNVYVEPTWLGFFKPVFDMVGKLGGRGKLLAGTDGPRWFEGFEGDPYEDLAAKGREMLGGDEDALHAFLWRNAARLLGLEVEHSLKEGAR